MSFYDKIENQLSKLNKYFESTFNIDSISCKVTDVLKSKAKEKIRCIGIDLFQNWCAIREEQLKSRSATYKVADYLDVLDQKIAEMTKLHLEVSAEQDFMSYSVNQLQEIDGKIENFLALSLKNGIFEQPTKEYTDEEKDYWYRKGLEFQKKALHDTNISSCRHDHVIAAFYLIKAKDLGQKDLQLSLETITALAEESSDSGVKPRHFVLNKLLHDKSLSEDHPLLPKIHEFFADLNFKGPVNEKIGHLFKFFKFFDPKSAEANHFLEGIKTFISTEKFQNLNEYVLKNAPRPIPKDLLDLPPEGIVEYQEEKLDQLLDQLEKTLTTYSLERPSKLPNEIQVKVKYDQFNKDPRISLFKSSFKECFALKHHLELRVALILVKTKEKLIEKFSNTFGTNSLEDNLHNSIYLKEKLEKKWRLVLE